MGQPGTPRRPTMADVASLAGVSLKTVSRVVNHVPSVDAALAERVNDAVARLGFRRNDNARNLASASTSSTIGLLIEDLANPFYAHIAAAAAQSALQHDSMLITASSEEDPEQERRLLLKMCERRVDGLLVVPAGGADHVYLRTEIERGTQVVFLDRPPTNLRADSVLIDNAQGARSAIEHLAAKGHEHIGVLSDWLSITTMTERLSAAEAALDRAGLPYRPDLVRYGLHTLADTEDAVAQMLAAQDPPTALFALNNRLTLGALGALDRLGHDAEMVGFDDFETAALVARPLTIVSYDAARIGRVGAELLFERIDGNRSRPRTVVVPTTLVAR